MARWVSDSNGRKDERANHGLVRHGFRAWTDGDFVTVESMQVVRERYEQGFARGEVEFIDGGAEMVVVVAHPSEIGGSGWPEETATVMTFKDERVRDMRDYRTKGEALATIARHGR